MNNIPPELIDLYRHWKEECGVVLVPEQNIGRKGSVVDNLKFQEIADFARERMTAWVKRSNNFIPTSDDPVIAKFKFCNVYRELDRQTIFFHRRLKGIENDFEKWLLNMFASRFIANIDTIEKIELLEVGVENLEVLRRLEALPRPKYGNAYVFPISTIKNSHWPTREDFLCLYVPNAIVDVAKVIKSQERGSVNEILDLILPVFGFNQRFLWTEVLIDVHYQFPSLVGLNRDFHIGPGAMPSLRYLKAGSSSVLEDEVLEELAQRHPVIDGVNLMKDGRPIPLSAENWEGICCEFRKYRNLRAGKGRRRIYKNI